MDGQCPFPRAILGLLSEDDHVTVKDSRLQSEDSGCGSRGERAYSAHHLVVHLS